MPLNPWMPTTNQLRLAVLGKLCEELGECTAAASRCIIQGINESEPTTGKPNKEWLSQEIGDVIASIEVAIEELDLDSEAIRFRTLNKKLHLLSWHELIYQRKG